jgi:predicted nucleotidyltransferase
MTLDELRQQKRDEILRVAARYVAYNVRIFGSVARGEAGAESDIDFLVDMEPDGSLFDVGGLLVELQDLLGQKVQVVPEKSLHWYIHDQVLREAKPL